MIDLKNVEGLDLTVVELLLNNREEFEEKFEDDLFGGVVVLGERALSDGDVIELKTDRLEIEDEIRFLVGLQSDTNGEEVFHDFNTALKDYKTYHPDKNNY